MKYMFSDKVFFLSEAQFFVLYMYQILAYTFFSSKMDKFQFSSLISVNSQNLPIHFKNEITAYDLKDRILHFLVEALSKVITSSSEN